MNLLPLRIPEVRRHSLARGTSNLRLPAVSVTRGRPQMRKMWCISSENTSVSSTLLCDCVFYKKKLPMDTTAQAIALTEAGVEQFHSQNFKSV